MAIAVTTHLASTEMAPKAQGSTHSPRTSSPCQGHGETLGDGCGGSAVLTRLDLQCLSSGDIIRAPAKVSWATGGEISSPLPVEEASIRKRGMLFGKSVF